MREHALKVETDMELFEIVGTGGDNAHSFNISTTSALVAAAGGMKAVSYTHLRLAEFLPDSLVSLVLYSVRSSPSI